MNLGAFSNLEQFLERTSLDPKGCFVDTSILFAASYPSDKYNEDAEPVFKTLSKFKLSSFTNVNVKYEFLELHRRVLLADSLVEFYRIYQSSLPQFVNMKLKSFETSHREKLEKDEASKIEPEQQKKYIRLLRPIILGDRAGWEILCKDFLLPQIEPIWNDACKQLGIVEIKVREADNSPLLTAKPDWENVVQIMGKHAIASSDAMIINMFKSSKIRLLLTADFEMARCMLSESQTDRFVFVPDSIFESLTSDKT